MSRPFTISKGGRTASTSALALIAALMLLLVGCASVGEPGNNSAADESTAARSTPAQPTMVAEAAPLAEPTAPVAAAISIDRPREVPTGDPVPITVSADGSPQTPTGTVAVIVDGTESASGELDGDGVFTTSASSGSPGYHRIEVHYSGDARFEKASESTSFTVTSPAGTLPANQAPWTPGKVADNPCAPTAAACVDLTAQRAWLQANGTITYGPVPISGGQAGYRSRPGNFAVFYKNKDHESSIFENSPMPNAVFFDGDIAFHAGDLAGQSHGCIRLNPGDSQVFWDALPYGAKVHVWGATPY